MKILGKVLFCLISTLVVATTFAQVSKETETQLDEPQLAFAQSSSEEALAIEDYWTQDRMNRAKPMPIPTVIVDERQDPGELDFRAIDQDDPNGAPAIPGFAPGFNPATFRRPDLASRVIGREDALHALATGGDLAEPQHGTKPSNPRTGPYGPFQRYTEFDSIKVYPKSAHGKLFFSLNGGNFVCSATVIGRNTLITAGHCNSDGNGTFARNRLFCPSYRNGQDAQRGCWAVVASKTSFNWHTNADPDYDYACLITELTGTKVNNRIGNVTGWLGRAWNFSSSQAVRTFGYPAGAPFNGNRLITTASTEWYTHDFRAGGQVSKIIGSDLTGGSSGGSWVLGWHRPGHEFPDTDGSLATDPGANWVNGVNSHKRCRTNCQSPPTNTTGVFWQEMTSPPFRNTNASDESEDIIGVCLANGGS